MKISEGDQQGYADGLLFFSPFLFFFLKSRRMERRRNLISGFFFGKWMGFEGWKRLLGWQDMMVVLLLRWCSPFGLHLVLLVYRWP